MPLFPDVRLVCVANDKHLLMSSSNTQQYQCTMTDTANAETSTDVHIFSLFMPAFLGMVLACRPHASNEHNVSGDPLCPRWTCHHYMAAREQQTAALGELTAGVQAEQSGQRFVLHGVYPRIEAVVHNKIN
eukprot:scaffold33818_cov21-Prasinocladus_malaysianus.AAC.1